MSMKRIVVVCLSVLILAGCSGIGDGNEPEALKVLPLASISGLTRDELDDLFDQDTEALTVLTCLSDAATAIVRFTDGDVGIFSERVTWVSSDDDVVTVSNGEDPVPGSGGLFFAAGTLKPIGPGTATVTAEYLGMRAEIPVVVEALDTSTIAVTPATAVLAPRSLQNFQVEAMVNGVLTSVSRAVTFRFTEPDEEVALLTVGTQGNAEVRAVAAAEPSLPMTLEANFIAPCGSNPRVQIQVAPLSSLELEYEDGFADGQLIAGSSQFLRATGVFDNVDLDKDDAPDTQDLSNQVQLTSTRPAVIGTGGFFDGPNRVTGGGAGTGGVSTAPPQVAVGKARVTASFGRVPDTDGEGPGVEIPGTQSNPLRFNSVDVVVNALAIEPAGPVTLAPRSTTNLSAFGTYTFMDVTRSIDLTRHVTWAVTEVGGEPVKEDDVPILFIQSGINLAAGTAVSLVTEDAAVQNSDVTITATYVRGVIDSTVPLPADDLTDLVQETMVLVREGAASEPVESSP